MVKTERNGCVDFHVVCSKMVQILQNEMSVTFMQKTIGLLTIFCGECFMRNWPQNGPCSDEILSAEKVTNPQRARGVPGRSCRSPFQVFDLILNNALALRASHEIELFNETTPTHMQQKQKQN
jgi:hypothetical protein